jgi:methylated-DNA-[protein]-cysteine S-methyltransferase
MRIAWATVPAPQPLGQVGVGVSEAGLALVSFGARRHHVDAAARALGAQVVADPVLTDPAAGQLREYFAGRRREFELPLDWRLTRGSQERVLRTLYESVGYGHTVTYGSLAKASGAFDGSSSHTKAFAARAVGGIMGSTPLPIVVPCHRVLAADGLGGFGGGLPTKRWLLTLEGSLEPMLDLGL